MQSLATLLHESLTDETGQKKLDHSRFRDSSRLFGSGFGLYFSGFFGSEFSRSLLPGVLNFLRFLAFFLRVKLFRAGFGVGSKPAPSLEEETKTKRKVNKQNKAWLKAVQPGHLVLHYILRYLMNTCYPILYRVNSQIVEKTPTPSCAKRLPQSATLL